MPARSALAALALVAGGAAGVGANAGAATTPATYSISLTVRFSNGAGKVERGTLTCRPGKLRATGVARPASRSCPRVRKLAGFLTSPPLPQQVCTQIYGGPQTARATGTINGRRVSRRFDRSNGCNIASYDRFARAFGR